MIIEFAGIPGCGKTTVARLVVAGLRRAGMDVESGSRMAVGAGQDPTKLRLYRRVKRRLMAVARYPEACVLMMHSTLKGRPTWRERWAVLRYVTLTLENYAHLKGSHASRRFHVFQEGIVQRAFMLFVGTAYFDGTWLARYAKTVPYPDVIVLLSLPIPEALRRLERRSRGLPCRLAYMSQCDIKRAMASGLDVLHSVADLFAAGRGSRVVTVGNDQRSAEDTATDVIARILAFCDNDEACQRRS